MSKTDIIERQKNAASRAYAEAKKCFYAGCYSASTLMFRAALEYVLGVYLGKPVTSQTLEKRIDEAVDRKILPEGLSESAHRVRKEGRGVAHRMEHKTKEEAESIMLDMAGIGWALLLENMSYSHPSQQKESS